MVMMFNFIPAAAQSFQIQTVKSVRSVRRNHLSESLLKVRPASSGKVTLKKYSHMKKSHYEVPTSELLVVRFEENIMSPQIDPNGTQRSTSKNGSTFGFDGWDDINE